jgi:hypothetical protein
VLGMVLAKVGVRVPVGTGTLEVACGMSA